MGRAYSRAVGTTVIINAKTYAAHVEATTESLRSENAVDALGKDSSGDIRAPAFIRVMN